MSYEEIDRSVYGKDVFTNGAEGRYAKPKPTSTNDASEISIKTSTTKKRAPKATSISTTDNPTEEPYENEYNDEVVKTKKKTRKVHENGETQNEDEISQINSTIDGEIIVKSKKKRASKIDLNNENIDSIPIPTTATTTIEKPVKKKKSKAPKSISLEEDFQMLDNSLMDELDEAATEKKVKKTKKHRTSKKLAEPTESFDDLQINNTNEYTTNSEFNDAYKYDGAYGSTAGDISYDAPPPYPGEDEQFIDDFLRSDYETEITDAYNNLAAAVDFGQYVGDDSWCIIYFPKSARLEPKSRIRKMLPGGKDDKSDGKPSTGKTTNEKGGFLNRLRSGVSMLVKDEQNLLFGERSNYDYLMYEDVDDDIDTDDLHRYAQKLRDLEDNDKEVNPEYLVLRDGKTVYAVQETDVDGKTKLSTRKPIYDRFVDQKPDDEPMEKKKIFSRIKSTFSRNKDKDNKSITSPKSTYDTPDANRKRSSKKSNSKYTDDGMATTANTELIMN